MSDISDIETIDRVLSGNQNAYEILVKKYQDRIFRYVYSRIPDYDEALDITQEIFVLTMESLHTFRRESKFSTWLYSIAINYCKNFKRKKRRYREVPIQRAGSDSEYELQLTDARQDPERDVIARDSLRIVMEELQKLPEDYRDILVLRDIEEESYSDIADILSISLSNVKVRIHRGREMLKSRLQHRGLL